jgi:hypothetical protein
MLDPDKVDKCVHELLKKRKQWENGTSYSGCSLSEFETHMETECEYLAKNCVSLFKMTVEGKLNMDYLNNMLNLMREVQSGHRKQDVADKIVGQRLADVYVQPLVEKLEKEKKK